MFATTLRRFRAPGIYLAQSRNLQTTSRLLARKDAQGKDDLKPESNEYSKSGSDQASAATEDAAFDPKKTSPEAEYEMAGKESGNQSNPLEVSPANQEVSKSHGPESPKDSPSENGQGSEGGGERSGSSGRGSAPKAGGGQSG